MSESGLYDLYCLHLVDARLLELKKLAGSLDLGKSILQAINDIKKTHQPEIEAYETGAARQKNLLERANSARDKHASIETMLYSGKVVNPREVMAYQEEMKGLVKTADDNELSAMQIEEELPELKAKFDAVQKEMRALAVEYKKKKEHDTEAYESIKKEFELASKDRPIKAQKVPGPLLKQYEENARKHGGVGMGVVTSKVCGACRTNLPERILQNLGKDRLITCEECKRILFMVAPL